MITSASECGICGIGGRGCVILSPVVSGSERIVSAQIGPRHRSLCPPESPEAASDGSKDKKIWQWRGDVKVMLPF